MPTSGCRTNTLSQPSEATVQVWCAATICGHLLRRQSELGIRGSVTEIGTFEGRFFIALGLAVGEGEHAYGFGLFSWPGSEVQRRYLWVAA